MGTEQWPVHQKTCRCGQGQFIVDHCEADHPYNLKQWLEPRIECATCATQYELVKQRGHIALVVREVIQARKELKERLHQERAALLQSKSAQDVVADRRSVGTAGRQPTRVDRGGAPAGEPESPGDHLRGPSRVAAFDGPPDPRLGRRAPPEGHLPLGVPMPDPTTGEPGAGDRQTGREHGALGVPVTELLK